ncbi:hypothetical protein AA0312_1338 [Acetobacter tropicalis NRIC 0312]|uniref:Uncharacterized protein n=1 Tax=Acetobacter tropicalis TaxID=104102 RepID=A0A511FM91_9PROT|nr:hypothetical protein ATR1_042d0077 [Acetobacter tropicalis]GBR69317.1 hypothetical protein AA0312_1338 [Acetobacter tropicalis NRIC 0312]GEL49667.1 hypothetical protein ATR01nite_07420 [Acetobacter tropicalis]
MVRCELREEAGTTVVAVETEGGGEGLPEQVLQVRQGKRVDIAGCAKGGAGGMDEG